MLVSTNFPAPNFIYVLNVFITSLVLYVKIANFATICAKILKKLSVPNFWSPPSYAMGVPNAALPVHGKNVFTNL